MACGRLKGRAISRTLTRLQVTLSLQPPVISSLSPLTRLADTNNALSGRLVLVIVSFFVRNRLGRVLCAAESTRCAFLRTPSSAKNLLAVPNRAAVVRPVAIKQRVFAPRTDPFIHGIDYLCSGSSTLLLPSTRREFCRQKSKRLGAE